MKKINLKKIKLSTKDEEQLRYFCNFMGYNYTIKKNKDNTLKKGVIIDDKDNFVGYIQRNKINLIVYIDKERISHSIFTKEEIQKAYKISKQIFNDEKSYKPNIRWFPKYGWGQNVSNRIKNRNHQQSKISRKNTEDLLY